MFTIKEFLGMDLIPWYKNLTSAGLPEDRPIEHVSVNDLPLDDFIRKNEMVISIATPYIEDEALMSEFIEGLIEANASLFLLALPSNTMKLSDANAKLAQDGGLPILLIPWDVRFADIVETVLDRLHKDYNTAVDKMKKLQEDMLKSFLNGSDIAAATQIIHRALGCRIVISDSSGNIISGSGRTAEMTALQLKSNGHLYGWLFLDGMKTQKSLDLLASTLSPLLSLWFYREEIIATTQSMAKEDLIWRLANGGDPGSEKIMRSAKLMDLHLGRTYACIVGRVRLGANSSDDWQKNWIDSNMNTVRSIFAETARSLDREVMVTHHNNAIIIYFEVSPASGKTQIAHFLDLIEERLRSTSKRLLFSWGISEIRDGATDFRNYYLHAKLAEELCANDNRLGRRYYYENTLIYNMMSLLSSDEEVMSNAYRIISPLVEYDKKHGSQLIDTLRTYLICKNISEVARRLGRHRQTLLYQLQRIEDLTGLSLKNSDELFLLECCMRLQVGFTAVGQDA